jgi:hypothetical protein
MHVSIVPVDSPTWRHALDRLDADVYHLAAYHRVAELNGEGRAYAFVAEDGDELVFHPFLRRSIERVGAEDVSVCGWSDLESAYGYAGPLATTADADFLLDAWSAFHQWCVEHGVVAEFTRFNPLLRNVHLADPDMRVTRDRETVVVELRTSAERLWAEYPPRQRNMVRKARASGLASQVVPAADGIGAFRSVYDETMSRIGASKYFAFGDEYFDALVGEMGLNIHAVVVSCGRQTAAAALLLRRRSRLHYHLSGTSDWARPLGATNLLLHAAAEWGITRGLSAFHLGGGRTSAPDDSLLRFKTSVSADRGVFETGRRVHIPAAYDALCESWRRQAGDRQEPPFFLLYRLEPC